MRIRKALSLILVISGLCFVCQLNISHARVQQSTIKIGALGPLALNPGKNMESGAKLAVKEINAAGGIRIGSTHYDFELIVETTSDSTTGLSSPSVAITSINKLQEQDDVVAALGLFRAETTIAVMAQLDRPFLGVGSTVPIISPYFWRTGASNNTQLTRSLIDFYAFGLGLQQGIRKVTIVREDASWTLAMRTDVESNLTTGLAGALPFNMMFTEDIVISQAGLYGDVEASFASVADDVDALMTIFSGPAGKHITEVWTALDMPQYLAGINVEAQTSTHFDETQGAAYGEIELELCPPDIAKTSKTQPFRGAYFLEYRRTPTYTAFVSYDAVYVIKDAIERADSTEATALQMALAMTDYEGATYNIKFTSEPGSQMAVAPNGSKIPIPGAPTNIIVHDLYTSAGFGVLDPNGHVNGYFAQWQQGGIKKTIWTRPEESVATRNVTKHIEWPINHTEHGWGSSPSPPSIDSPVDISYEEGTSGHNITWHPSDTNSTNYVLYFNGSFNGSGLWIGGDLSFNIDGLGLGIYNYTIIVFDQLGTWTSDTVWVTVTPRSSPDTETSTIPLPSESISSKSEVTVGFTIRVLLIVMIILFLGHSRNRFKIYK